MKLYKIYYVIRSNSVLALISGLVMGLTTIYSYTWILAWVALVPLWTILLEVKNPRLSIKQATLLGLLWGIGYHGCSLSWIVNMHPLAGVEVNWMLSFAINTFCFAICTLWGSLIVAIWAGLMVHFVSQKLPLIRLVLGIALWCSIEWLWQQSSLYWSSIAFTQSSGNLIILHLSQLSGSETVTAAIILVNGFLSEALINSKNRNRYIRIAILLFFSMHLLGWFLYNQPLLNQSQKTALKIGIIQGNVPSSAYLSNEGQRHALKTYIKGYEELAVQGAEAVLTPEGAFPFTWKNLNEITNPSRRTLVEEFYQAIGDRGIPIWLGTRAKREEERTQSLLTITGNGKIVSRYDKVKLLPMWEQIPFNAIIGNYIRRNTIFKNHISSGKPEQQFNTPFGVAIVSICNDSAFPQLFRSQARLGGEFIITASNDDSFNDVMMAQHYAQDRMRSIETDRWAIRATNTGISGLIDPHGNSHWQFKIGAYESRIATIYRRTTQTLYVRWGNWLTPFLFLIVIILEQLKFGLRLKL